MKNPDQGHEAPGRAQIGLPAFTEIQARSRCLETCCQVLYRAGNRVGTLLRYLVPLV